MRFGFYVLFSLLCFMTSAHVSSRKPQDKEKTSSSSIKDVPLESYQYQLLDLAFSAVSAMPAYPHIKNRSRAQEAVVTACLMLDQPQLAHKYIKQINNWRRGACYADLAFYCALHGFIDEAETNLNQAIQFSEEAEDWRKDRIKVKISKTYTYLEQTEAAKKFEQGIEASESGKVAGVKAMICKSEAFEERLSELEKLISTKNFDIVKNTLDAYVELYKRFYSDIKRRKIIEEKIRVSWNNMPISIRIDLLMELADCSLDQNNQDKALEMINEAKKIMDSAIWQPRFEIPLRARLAGLRFDAGNVEQAKTELKSTLEMFDTNREKIVNIYRTQVLRPIAEANHAIGNNTVARDLYKKALEAGIENPNSRPRAEDLAATCCSMALHAFEPDAELLSLIREIHNGLGDPW